MGRFSRSVRRAALTSRLSGRFEALERLRARLPEIVRAVAAIDDDRVVVRLRPKALDAVPFARVAGGPVSSGMTRAFEEALTEHPDCRVALVGLPDGEDLFVLILEPDPESRGWRINSFGQRGSA